MEVKIAIYMRSSLEQDEDKRNTRNPDESDTIANQRKYLYKNAYARGYRKEQIIEYIDDGYTGTNFNRPAFEQMIRDIEAGMIKAVMIKDFSRLGRDYIGVGNYVEQFFPLHNVRIISINDNWDSNEHIGETMELDASFRTIVYEMYSRDLSVKRKSANMARHNNGIFIGAYVPYGYKKVHGDTHSIVIDEKCAPVVKRIFELFNSGEKIANIAKILSDEGIPIPGISKDNFNCYGKGVADLECWSSESVRRILRNEMYTGTLILNRLVVKEFRSRSCVINDPSEWIRFPDNHKPIISMDEFQKANARLLKRPRGGKSGKQKTYPFFCGHCGCHLCMTSRNEGTLICTHGIKLPADACGQIEIRRDKLEKIVIMAINSQADILLEQYRKRGTLQKNGCDIQGKIDELTAEAERYHDQRFNLYQQFRKGLLDKESFMEKKDTLLRLEEECLEELETEKDKLLAINDTREYYSDNLEVFRTYSFLDKYDHEIVNHLVSKIKVFNDGHIKIVWNYQSEFGNLDAEDCFTDDNAGRETGAGVSREGKAKDIPVVAIYTSDMFLMPQEDNCDELMTKKTLENYAKETLGIPCDNMLFYSDSRCNESLFFREGYMKFIDSGRSRKADILLIRSFKDLYLSHQQMNDLMFWILPKLSCRLISIEDNFDSSHAAERKYREMYEQYKGVRRGDLHRFRAVERKSGLREPKICIHCRKLYGYYLSKDGCYAIPEIQGIVKRIFWMAREHHNLDQAVLWLNEEGIQTPWAFFKEHGYNLAEERHPEWTKEKVWGVVKQEGYVQQCRHYDKCMEIGRHCEKMPIIDQETFDEVNRYCRYRNDR